MTKFMDGQTVCAPLYIHSFCVGKAKQATRASRFLLQNQDPQISPNIGDRIRYFRYRSGLLQKDIIAAIGVDRSTYIHYEKGMVHYPLDKLSTIAELLGVDIQLLLDDYHRFLYEGQGRQIRAIRKTKGLSRKELAKDLGVHAGTVKRWELGTIKVTRSIYEQLFEGEPK